MICHYDGSFAGLLTLYDQASRNRLSFQSISRPPHPSSGLFESPVTILTNPETAESLQQWVFDHLGRRTLSHLRLAFLSEQDGIELILCRYLDFGEKVGRLLNSYQTHPDVHAVMAWSRRTVREVHRMKGFVRFRKLSDGTFYAPFRSQANLVSLLAPHFSSRMDRPWLLHDVHRNLGALGRKGRFVLGTIAQNAPYVYAEQEGEWQALWQSFHQSIAIDSRRNLQRQKQFMPLKYRRFLVECQATELA